MSVVDLIVVLLGMLVVVAIIRDNCRLRQRIKELEEDLRDDGYFDNSR